VSLRTGPDEVERRKILPLPGLEFLPSAVQLVASLYTDFLCYMYTLMLNLFEIKSNNGRLDFQWES
jgi:hypothetical protein